MSRSLAILILLTLVGCALAPAAGVAQDRSAGEDPGLTELGFVTVEIPGILRQEMNARFAGDTLLVPYVPFASLLNIAYRVSPDLDTLYGELPSSDGFTIVRSSGVVVRRERIDTIGLRAVRVIDGEPYVETVALGRALRLGMVFRLNDLELVVAADRRIPSVQRARNVDRYEAVRAAKSTGRLHLEAPPLERLILGNVMLDWNVSSSQQRDRLTHNGAFTLSGPLLYGVLSARGNARFSPDEGMHLNVGGYQWRFSVPELPAVQSFGVSFSPGTNVGAVGFGVSNSSVLDVRAQTTTRTIEGTTEPGWDVELYDGQDLVDAVRTDSTGRYAFEVSMIASRSDRTIVFRGPNGERIVETRHLQAGSGVIPVGELRYGLNAYTSGISDTVPVSGDLTMTLGVTDRVSVGLDTRVSSRSLRGLALEDADVQLKAAIDFGDQTPVTLKVSPRSGVFGGTVQFVPFGDGAINVSADSVHVVDGTYLVGVSSGVSLGPVTLAGGGRVYNLSDRFGFDISPIAFARILGVTISSSLRYAYEEVEVIGERTPSDEPRTKLLGRLGVSFSPVRRVHLRTGMSYDFMRRAIDESSASIGLSLIRGVGLDVTYSMRGTDWRNGRLGAGLNFGLPFATATVYSSYDQEELIVRSRLSGSAALSLADLEIDGSGNGTRSAIEVRGYNDRNHNGMWDSGEEALGPVRADLFNGQGERTGSGVDFYGLAPYRECIVVIDHNQFAEEDLFPRRSRYRFAQMPSSVEIIEVPFDVGRDLIGRCQIVLDGRLGNPAVMLGSRVALVAVDGSARYDGEFFQDGTCLLSGVAPGEYRIVFDDAQLAARRLEVAEMPATVTVDETLEELPMVSLTVVATESTPVETGGH